MSERPGIQVNISLDGKEAFSFQKNSRAGLGYILSWDSLSGMKLEPDLEIVDPENPTGDKLKVVAVLHGDSAAFWKGGPTDDKKFKGLLSGPNRAKLSAFVNSADGSSDQKLEYKIKVHDDAKDVYFPTFYTEGPVSVVFTPNEICEVSSTPFADVSEPRTFPFVVTFTAKGKAGPQKLYCNESPDIKTVKQFGGVAAAAS